MIKFCANGVVKFDGQPVELTPENAEDFFVANLASNVEFEAGLRLEILMMSLSNLRGFIFKYFSEHFDNLKPLIESHDVGGRYVSLTIFKKIVIENDFLFIQTSVDLNESVPPNSLKFLGQLPIILSHDVVVIESEEGKHISGDVKSDITLLQVLEALFEDFTYSLRQGFL